MPRQGIDRYQIETFLVKGHDHICADKARTASN
jgi:hypothetical protein